MNVQTSGPRYAVFAALVAAATMAFAGCGGGGGGGSSLSNCLGYGGGGGGTGGAGSCGPQQSAPSPSPTPDTGAQPVALLLTGQSSVNIAPYGGVLGYNNGNSAAAFATGSNVVNLTANQAMQFFNTEASGGNPHTASSLGAWSGSFPASGHDVCAAERISGEHPDQRTGLQHWNARAWTGIASIQQWRSWDDDHRLLLPLSLE